MIIGVIIIVDAAVIVDADSGGVVATTTYTTRISTKGEREGRKEKGKEGKGREVEGDT